MLKSKNTSVSSKLLISETRSNSLNLAGPRVHPLLTFFFFFSSNSRRQRMTCASLSPPCLSEGIQMSRSMTGYRSLSLFQQLFIRYLGWFGNWRQDKKCSKYIKIYCPSNNLLLTSVILSDYSGLLLEYS